jgi:hypothetical protein
MVMIGSGFANVRMSRDRSGRQLRHVAPAVFHGVEISQMARKTRSSSWIRLREITEKQRSNPDNEPLFAASVTSPM